MYFHFYLKIGYFFHVPQFGWKMFFGYFKSQISKWPEQSEKMPNHINLSSPRNGISKYFLTRKLIPHGWGLNNCNLKNTRILHLYAPMSRTVLSRWSSSSPSYLKGNRIFLSFVGFSFSETMFDLNIISKLEQFRLFILKCVLVSSDLKIHC